MDAIPEVYDMLLSLRVVAAAMRRDISGHVANVRGSMLRLPDAQGTTLQGIVRYGLANHDRNELAKDPSSIVGGVLWLKCVCRRSNSDPLRPATSLQRTRVRSCVLAAARRPSCRNSSAGSRTASRVRTRPIRRTPTFASTIGR